MGKAVQESTQSKSEAALSATPDKKDATIPPSAENRKIDHPESVAQVSAASPALRSAHPLKQQAAIPSALSTPSRQMEVFQETPNLSFSDTMPGNIFRPLKEVSPEHKAAETRIPEQSENGIFEQVSNRINGGRQLLSADLLMGEVETQGSSSEQKSLSGTGNYDEKIHSATLSQEGIRPKREIQRLSPVPEVAEKNFPYPEATQATPTIKISIGRIEVRATVQSPQPVKERTPSNPKIDLDEYLKKQSGGKR